MMHTDNSEHAKTAVPQVAFAGEHTFSPQEFLASNRISNGLGCLAQKTSLIFYRQPLRFSGVMWLLPVLLLLALSVAAHAKTITANGLIYTSSNSQITITGYSGAGGALSIPGTIIGLPVVIIGEKAFISCNSLTSVTIPDSVTTITDQAFNVCSNLTSVTIGSGVTSIGDFAFQGCAALTSITIPNSVTSIGAYVFNFCNNLASVTIGNSVTSIADGAFHDCPDLTSITIPNSVITIGQQTFYGCNSLTSVTIGNSVTTLGNGAFSECAMTSITIPNSVATIGPGAFSGCYNLASVTIPNSVTSLGFNAFGGCNSLASVTFGTGITSIGQQAFSNCLSLTNVTIPNNVTSIGDEAFLQCNRLASVTIGTGVTTIGQQAFYQCSSLASVTFPNNVTSIGDMAFLQCGSLTSVTFGTGITSIGNDAFLGCNNLNSAIFMGNAPATMEGNVFNDSGNSFTVYFYNGATGFTVPTWYGYPAIEAGTNAVVIGGSVPAGIPNARFVSFGNPAINDLDGVAFQAVVSGSGIKAANNSGIWAEFGGEMGLVASTGSATAYRLGSSVQSGTFNELGDPVFNNSNEVAFLGTIKTGTGKSEATIQAIWTAGTKAGLVEVARVRGQVPDVTGTLNGLSIASFAQFVLTDQGSVVFLANLNTGDGDTNANNLGLWAVDSGGQSHFIARKGFPVTTGTGPKITALSIFAPATGVDGQTRGFNPSGDLMFAATFANGMQGIFAVSPQYIISPVRVTSNIAPLALGSGRFAKFESPIINGVGNAAFQATISGTGITATNNTGIWAESGKAATLGLVARVGVPASYTGTGSESVTATFTTLGNPVFNANDQVAFIGTAETKFKKTVTSSQGIWTTGTAGSSDLRLVTQVREQAVGCENGVKFSSFARLVLPDQGGVVFVADVAGKGVTAANNQGLWTVDTAGQLNLVARKGDLLTNGKTIAALSIFTASETIVGEKRSFVTQADNQSFWAAPADDQSPGALEKARLGSSLAGNGAGLNTQETTVTPLIRTVSTATAGQTRNFNHAGDLVYKATFTDRTQSIYKVVFP